MKKYDEYQGIIELENSPKYKVEKFQCPHCQVTSQQRWFDATTANNTVNSIIQHMYLDYRTTIQDYQQEAVSNFLNSINPDLSRNLQRFVPNQFSIATCGSCSDVTLWISQEMVYPRKTSLPAPNEDIDEEIRELYLEATTIFVESPKGSTALLRLALQKLLKQVGKSGKNINNDIKELVSEGLSPKIQQALDLVRVIGNNAVHPGQINLDDNSNIALKLFHILNFIADEMITKPKELELLYSDIIPEETQEHIKQRDGK